MALPQNQDMGMDMPKNKAKKLFAFNSLSGVLQMVLSAILLFVSISLFIKNLGDDLYGIFCAVGVIGNLTSFGNLSLDATLIKFLTEQGKSQKSNYDIVTTLVLMLIIILPVSITLIVFRDSLLVNVLDIPFVHLESTSSLFVYLVLANIVLLVGKVFTSILESQNKIYISNSLLFLYTVLYWGGISILILSGRGLESIGKSILLSAILWLILAIGFALKTWGKISCRGLRENFKVSAKKQLKYGSQIYTASIFGFLHEPLTKILIANFIGLSAVGFFDIALKIKSQIMALFLKMLYPLYPVIGNSTDMAQIRMLVKKASEYLFFLIIPFVVGLIFCTTPFIEVWLHSENTSIISLSTIVIVGTALLFSIPVMPLYFFIRIKNHPDKEIYIQAINGCINILIIVLFYKLIGIYAMLLGNLLSLLSSFILCLYYQKKYLDGLPFTGNKDLLKLIGCFGVVFIPTFVLSLVYTQSNVYSIVLTAACICVFTVVALMLFKVVKKNDLKFSER